jgi:TolB-like protein/tRNA A-37 threonylcarbamoyl transferase component Bud32/Flp pilus assembly protein TadD
MAGDRPDRFDDRLLDVADSVAGGGDVDWAAASTVNGVAERELLEQLRLIDAVARLHRSAGAAIPTLDRDALPLQVGERWAHLVIAERVGGGTFGHVYLARDTTLDRDVALKLLRQRTRAAALASQFLAEGRLLARVAHPNVITVYGAESIDGRVGLWMEFIRGLTLEDVLRQHGAFSAREATFIGLDLCRALAAVHATGLVHRDVKAANVMREQGGRIVLMDFGAGEDLDATGDEQMAGTPLYLAPEIFAGQAATVRSDLYSLGVLLYRLTTGGYPVSGNSLAELAAAHRDGRSVRLRDARPNLPDGFVHVIERALSPSPEQRFESAGAMEQALAGWLGGIATLEPPAPVFSPPPTTRARWPVAAAALMMALVLVAALTLMLRRPAKPAPAALPGAIRSVAVLPLQNIGAGDYFADGMTEALIADLGRTGVLDVISRTSVMRFKGSQQPLPEIAKALNVDAVVEGSVLRDGRRVRITAQLIDARTDKHLWANSYERDVRDVLALQADVARAIAQEVRSTLSRQQEASSAQIGRRQVPPEAFEAYLQGRFYWNRRGGDALIKSVDYFEQAIKIDPGYAAAYSGLADTYTLMGSVGGTMGPAAAMANAKKAAEAALKLDDSLAEAHTSLAMLHFWYDWDWAASEREFKLAIARNRSYPTAHHWYAIYLSAMGRHDEAIVEIDQAVRLDPVSPIIRASRGWVQYHRRDYDGSILEAKKALDLDADFVRAHTYLGMNYLKKGLVSEAVRSATEADRLGGGIPITRAYVGQTYAAAGRTAEAHQILADLIRPTPGRYVSPSDIAALYVWLGDNDRAMDWLAKAFDERSFNMVYLKVHPGYDPLRQDPRFIALLRRLAFP